MQEAVYTIGHSTHPLALFIDLLRIHGITALGDVRSSPYSRMNSQFNREELSAVLEENGIRYVFLGKELGARSDDPSCYLHGRVQYQWLARTELFQSGLDRVQKGAETYRLALMCAEKEPLECHRTILVSRYLAERGVPVRHIHADATLESHEDAMMRLAHTLRLRESEQHLFRTHEDLLADAYSLQEQKIGYTQDPNETSIPRSKAG